jgi:hypothetical protein
MRRRCGDKSQPVETLASVSPRIIHAGLPNVETLYFFAKRENRNGRRVL